MKLVLLGPPGAGKGTQAKSISMRYNIPHISTGEIFRKHIAMNTELGTEAKKYIDKGQLVPDELTIDIVEDRLNKDDCMQGFLLDGFPRTVNQAKSLDQFLNSRKDGRLIVIHIEVPREEILSRMTGRRVCSNCGASYHVKFKPPKTLGVCDICGGELIHRDDDKLDTVEKRLIIYEMRNTPLVEFYKEKGLLYTVDGTKSIEDVFNNICEIIGAVNK